MERVHRKTQRSPKETARLQTIQDHVQREWSSLDEVVKSEADSEPVKHGVTLDAIHIATLLKQARKDAQLSLAEVAKRSGVSRSSISRLENGLYDNMTINTLGRLARAYGKRFVIQLVDES